MKAGFDSLPVSEQLVSVLIPAYNAAVTIAETLASVRAQTHQRLEILVVDDGSTDATPDIVSETARQDGRVRLIRQQNAGVAAARNHALRVSSGELIAPLDADDLWHPAKLERQIHRLAAEPENGLVYCWSADIDEQSNVTERRLSAASFEGDVYSALIVDNFIGNSSVPLIRRRILEEVGGWDASLRAADAQGCEDWLFYLSLASRSRFVLEPAFLVGYRQSSGAMSRQIRKMTRSYHLVMDRARSEHPELPHRLFRWSEAGYYRYLALMQLEMGRPVPALFHLLRAVAFDPTSMLRRQTARDLLRRRKTRAPRQPSASPIGHPFAELDPAPPFLFPENRIAAQRRELYGATPVLGRLS